MIITDSNNIQKHTLMLIIAVCYFFCISTQAQNTANISLNDTIKEIVIVGNNPQTTSQSKYGESTSISAKNLGKLTQTLGSADALKYIQSLPGVQNNNDYTAGISIQGCEFSQSTVDMEGATIFYPYHFMGIFSACNNNHFPKISIEKSAHSTSFPNKLGGKITLHPHQDIPSQFSGNADIGIISSGLSLSIPVSSKCAVILSGRLSYLNLLYSGILSNEDNDIKYDFFDSNITFLYKKDTYNTFSVNMLYGKDKLENNNKDSFLGIDLGWKNLASSLSWNYDGRFKSQTALSFSSFSNSLNIQMPEFNSKIPSEISQISLKEDIKIPLNDILDFNGGATLDYYHLRKNSSQTTGLGANNNNIVDTHINATESRLYGEVECKPSNAIQVGIGIKTSFYNNADFHKFNIDPCVTIKWDYASNKFSINAGIYHQYLHQSGFSNIGMPSDFWFLSDNLLLPQKAYSISAIWKRDLPLLNMIFSAEIYYKRMLNQSEFEGSILGVLDSNFMEQSNFIKSHGFNTGIDLLLQKQFGRLSGWLSYSFGLARRKIIGEEHLGYIPSSRESLHNISLILSYRLNAKWHLSSNFTYTSGAPTTPIKSVYMLGENILCEYGEHNSWNLPDYHRLDISASYQIPHKIGSKVAQSLNFSIVNAYAHKNIMMQYFTLDEKESTFKYKEIASMFKVLPSISYRIDF